MSEAYIIIRKAIEGYERGTMFFADNLSDLGTQTEVDAVLAQLIEEKVIIRITDGFYVYPKPFGRFGIKYERPWVDEAVRVLAQHNGFRLAPTAAYSQNALHLSTQVQVRHVYLTDAESQELTFYDKVTISLRQFTDFDLFSFRSELMQMMVVSLHNISEKWVTDKELAILRQFLSHVSEEDFHHDLCLSPKWIADRLSPLYNNK